MTCARRGVVSWLMTLPRLRRRGGDVVERAVTAGCFSREDAAARRQFVVAARRALLASRDAFLLPARPDEPLGVQAAEDRVDGAARKAGGVDDVEPVVVRLHQGLEDERGGVGDAHRFNTTYVDVAACVKVGRHARRTRRGRRTEGKIAGAAPVRGAS